MKLSRITALSAVLMGLSLHAQADWELNNSESKLNFVSTKNVNVSELHNFGALSGTLSNSGAVQVSVDLKTVNTNIPIRDERMQAQLFEVTKTPQATLNAQLPKAVLNMQSGETIHLDLDADISIKNTSAAYKIGLTISKNNDGSFAATTSTPILIDANKHNLVTGIETLQKLAGLTSISLTVPVTFSVIFASAA
ncbi:YceI family protein [Aliiglaciecola sp. LCG003]|uniref:YceI family protein n=1 Tax=Aliiglaciecola sp. LCG003 TaxID=3053655 RepID=UPI002572A956|nr:YceI family protein [Aliiglaciecola sp. LCG003]WJG09314.1 YceI family protein [Aliiglaciecola sp. LCG003]